MKKLGRILLFFLIGIGLTLLLIRSLNANSLFSYQIYKNSVGPDLLRNIAVSKDLKSPNKLFCNFILGKKDECSIHFYGENLDYGKIIHFKSSLSYLLKKEQSQLLQKNERYEIKFIKIYDGGKLICVLNNKNWEM